MWAYVEGSIDDNGEYEKIAKILDEADKKFVRMTQERMWGIAIRISLDSSISKSVRDEVFRMLYPQSKPTTSGGE